MKDVTGRIARGWNRDPTQSLTGVAPEGVSAAFWNHEAAHRTELEAPGSPNVHILALRLSTNVAQLRADGKVLHEGATRAGTLGLLRAGERVGAVYDGSWRILHLYLPVPLVDNVTRQNELPRSFERLELPSEGYIVDPVLERYGREVLVEMQAGLPLARARIDCLGQEVIIQLLRRQLPEVSLDVPEWSASDWRYRRAVTLFEDRIGEDLSIGEVARAVGISAVHLNTLFRKVTGLSPHQWLLRRKVERAKQLLAKSRHSIAEIALQCGFSSSQHLATVFRKQTGMTPTDYRSVVKR